MLFGHGGARSGYGFLYAGLVARNHVHVPFHYYYKTIATNRFFGLIQTENKTRLIKKQSFRRIKILRLALTEDTSGIADYIASGIYKRHHHAIAKHIRFKTVQKPCCV